MTSFSVIIPTYNRHDFLMACLDSVAAQRRRPDEVIVVDDGSTDGTRETVAAREGVTLIKQENAGPGAARNRGAAAARGDYLAFLDSDDLWFPWSLEAMAALIDRHGKPSLLFASFKDFVGAAPIDISGCAPDGQTYPDFLSSAEFGCFAGAGMMTIEREAFLQTGGFGEVRINAEDHDLALRLGTAPGFVQVAAPVLVAHRLHGGNEVGSAELNLAGVERLVLTENAELYPGALERRRERRTIISLHVRPVVIESVKAGKFRRSAQVFRDTWTWNLREGRYAYLLAVPALAVLKKLRLY